MKRLVVRLRKFFWDLPLVFKLILGVLTLVVTTVLIAVVALLAVLQNSLTSQLGNNLHGLANSAANNLGDHIAAEVSSLEFLAHTQSVVYDIEAVNSSYGDSASFARDRIQQLNSNWLQAEPGSALRTLGQNLTSSVELRRFLTADPINVNLIATDQYGGSVAYTTQPARFDLSDEEWYVQAYNQGAGKVYISPATYDPVEGFYLTIAVPIYRANTRTAIGVLHTRYRLKDLVQQLDETRSASESVEAYLVTLEGTRLDTTAGGDIKVPTSELDHLSPQAIQAVPWRVAPYGFDPSLIAYAPVIINEGPLQNFSINWTVIVRQNLDKSLASAQAVVRVVLLVSVIGLAVIILFTIAVSRALTDPITELTKITNEAQRGNLNVVAPAQGRDEIGQLAQAFNVLIAQVRHSTAGLEQKVLERNQQLAAINEIATAVSTSLNIDEVLASTVNLIRDRLGYYHVSIFLLDEKSQYAVVRESTGDVGRIMKERGHRLAIGSQSIIGNVTAQRKARIVLDVTADAIYFNNPLLPRTRSEIALPLIVGEQLLGALDVQSTQPNAFEADDVTVLQSMANQVAIAINNAHLFQEAQSRLVEVTRLNRQYLAESWEGYARQNPDTVALKLEGNQIQAAPDLSNAPLDFSQPYLSDNGTTLIIPIKLREQVIGEFSLMAPAETIRWTEDDLFLAEGVVNQVALAVENARLLEETQTALQTTSRWARRERVITEVTQKITAGLDLRRVLQVAADELQRHTGSTRAVVTLTVPEAVEDT